MRLVFALIVIININSCFVHPAKILGIFPLAARSHYFLSNSLMKGLAEAGHDVTMVSPFEDNIPPSNGTYRNMVLTGFLEHFSKILENMDLFQVKDENSFEHELRLAHSMLSLIEKTFSHPVMEKLLESNEEYDAVIVEQFANDALKYFGYHYKAPLIVFSVIPACSWFNDMVGNPTKLSYTPQINSGYPPNMSILQRVRNTLIYVFQKLSYHFYVFPKHNEILKTYFPIAPSVGDLYHNASLVLLNSHESFGQPVPHVPNMIQIGGFHVKATGTLSGPLKEFLDNSTEGVVYFSMGTNLPSENLPTWKRDVFLKVFGKLKQKVLWKWEDDLPGKPQNVKVEKWLPQQEILAHPNVKLFITHGGLLSNIETIYHGVPTLTIPVFGDQHSNARRAVIQGYSLSIPYHDPKFSEEELTTLLQELLTNPNFSQPVSHVPNMIQIGGFHGKPPGTLSGTLKEFLDNSTEGVVYFSMGTNLPTKNLPTWRRDVFLNAFGKLKQKVLWKWEDDLPGKPHNVKVEKWLPQQDILAHPNIKLFITHGGLLSNIETIYHGVPTLTIPVFGDQHSNARRAVIQGYSLSMPYHDPKFSEEELTILLQELLTNTKYRKNVQERSRIFHDRPMHPMDTATYWVDYVIRHRGAPHLRVAGIHLPWYTDLLLDVATISMATIISTVLVIYLCVLKLKNVFTKRIEKSKTH